MVKVDIVRFRLLSECLFFNDNADAKKRPVVFPSPLGVFIL